MSRSSYDNEHVEIRRGISLDLLDNSEEFFYLNDVGNMATFDFLRERNGNSNIEVFQPKNKLLFEDTHIPHSSTGTTSSYDTTDDTFIYEMRERSSSRLSTMSNMSSTSNSVPSSIYPVNLNREASNSSSVVEISPPNTPYSFTDLSYVDRSHPPGFQQSSTPSRQSFASPEDPLHNGHSNGSINGSHNGSINGSHNGTINTSLNGTHNGSHNNSLSGSRNGSLTNLSGSGIAYPQIHDFDRLVQPASIFGSTSPTIIEVPASLRGQLSDLDQRRGLAREVGRTLTPPQFHTQQPMYQYQQHNQQRNKLSFPSRSHSNSLDSRASKSSINLSIPRDTIALEETVVKACQDILKEANNLSLKAVELANTLRARVGTDPLAIVREIWGGLLTLLENYPLVFQVERIPKNDIVSLISTNSSSLLRQLPNQPNPPLSPFSTTTDDIRVIPSRQTSKDQSIEVPSRCLHVSNISASTTEADIQATFGAHGEVEDITMVSQRSRRFAFVRYRYTDDASRAKQRLATVQPWANNISFAHSEEPNSNLGFSSYTSPRTTHHNKFNINTSNSSSTSVSEYGANTPTTRRSPSTSFDEKSFSHRLGTISSSQEMFHPRARGQSAGSSASANVASWFSGASRLDTPLPPSTHSSHMSSPLGTIETRFSKAIIAILTDDTYVPTQAWNCKFHQDAPFLNAVITQLQILGGLATISKLRGLLKSRIFSAANIKSVPLKALLAAYPKYFTLNSNLVELTPEYMYSQNHTGSSLLI